MSFASISRLVFLITIFIRFSMPSFERFHHVGITVTPRDLEATIQWYSTHLGFVVEKRFEAVGISFVFLTASGMRIELLTSASAASSRADDVLDTMDPSRLHHICLEVTDLAGVVRKLDEEGVTLVGGPMDVASINKRIAFIPDNLGNMIELLQPLE